MSMIDKRLTLHNILVNILGSNNVYYQPPSNITMRYPAIVYSKNNIKDVYANNEKYKRDLFYKVTVIDSNPDSKISEEISLIRNCRYDRSYVINNLNHDVYIIYVE